MRATAIATALLGLTVVPAAAQLAKQFEAGAGGAPEIRAQLTPRNFATISSETAARIDKIATRIGEEFKKGDTLVLFECAAQRAQQARASAVVTQAEKAYAINERLFALKSIGQLELDVSQAEVRKAKADYDIATAAVSKCTIVAPYDGITVEQHAREFQYAAPGQALIDIVDNRSLDIDMIVPSRWLAWLKTGTPFKFQVHETNRTYDARIVRISGRVDPVSQSVRAIGVVSESAPELTAGMSGAVLMAGSGPIEKAK
ncbi:MAG: efflux RND transporter periplasmic adaptor subunit [Pseudolabrys sp.]